MGKKKVAQKSGDTNVEEKAKAPVASASSKKVETGTVYVNATYNNTVITVTDSNGNVLAWSSAGTMGFSGPKKATPFAASKIVAALAEKMKKNGPFNINIIIKGVGSGRDSAVRTFAAQGFNILSIKDATPIPHNGPRPPKVRRV
jgi:small subunit ribosomal protein S11